MLQPARLLEIRAIHTVRKDDDMHEAASLHSLFAEGEPVLRYLVVFLVELMDGLTVIEKRGAKVEETKWRIGEWDKRGGEGGGFATDKRFDGEGKLKTVEGKVEKGIDRE